MHGCHVQVRNCRSKDVSVLFDIVLLVDAGNDNTSKQCIVGDVPDILDGHKSDHDGPYDGVTMGC